MNLSMSETGIWLLTALPLVLLYFSKLKKISKVFSQNNIVFSDFYSISKFHSLKSYKDTIEKYLEFLQSGGRDYPLEVLKIIDVDLNDTKVFESALKDFKNTLDEFKKNYYEK